MYNSETLRMRLYDLGFEVEENEEELLLAALKRAEQTIMNKCNCESIPEELNFVAIDMAAGEYLLAVQWQNEDSKNDVKSLSEGDISVSFKDESELKSLVDELLARSREELLSYRRIKW